MSSSSCSGITSLPSPMARVGIDRGYASCASYTQYKRAFRAAFTLDQASSSSNQSAASLSQRVTHPKHDAQTSSNVALDKLFDRCVAEQAFVDRALTAVNKHLATQPPGSEPRRSHKVWIMGLFGTLRGLQNHTNPEKFWSMEVVQRALNSARDAEPPEIQKLWNQEVLSLLCPKEQSMKSNPYHALFDGPGSNRGYILGPIRPFLKLLLCTLGQLF